MIFQTELTKLGLKDKEAAVYLACLELGPSPVQTISRKAKVVRATTYVVLEALMARGLITRYKEGKKTLFAGEPPRQLLRLLEKQQDEIKEKQHELENMLPELQILMKSAKGRPTVRYFDGVEGLRAIRREMMMYSQAGDTWYNFTPMDYLTGIIGEDEDDRYYNQRIAKKIVSKTIFTTKSTTLKENIIKRYTDKMTVRKFVSSEVFPSPSGMTIFRDRIAIGSFSGSVGGVIIESEQMADMMRRMFELAWIGAEKVDKKKDTVRL
jgi:HTH-type transcriptional regulator, sugar sensing transcriptional regulator